MRTALILLALVGVLGAAREAEASLWTRRGVAHDYTLSIGSVQIGFVDGWEENLHYSPAKRTLWSRAGVSGFSFDIPFTATQGLIGSIVIAAVLVIVPIMFVVGWKREDNGA